ncbi:putative zinc finger motif, C2HC5-type-domain-containing protein [Sporodiniella umbellata]|nr:putative zinc finger motif, C2HC5-type-domain-containing protein [Sporodiniella umbellata]
MASFDSWAQDKLCMYLGFDMATIQSQVWPYVMSTKTAETFGERLIDMLGLTDDTINFIEEFTNRRFYPKKDTPAAPAPTQDPVLANAFPDLPTVASEMSWPVNISVSNKKEEEYLASLKKARKKKPNQELREAALLVDPKPKKNKKKEIPIATALKELGISTRQKTCTCQATLHPLLPVAPNCLNCGRIRCTAEGIGPCAFCKMPMISEDQELLLIAEAKKKRTQQSYAVDKEKMLEKQDMHRTKVMTINSVSKQVTVKVVEEQLLVSPIPPDDSEGTNTTVDKPMAKLKNPRGFYAYNPLLKTGKGSKFVKAKSKKQAKVKEETHASENEILT